MHLNGATVVKLGRLSIEIRFFQEQLKDIL